MAKRQALSLLLAQCALLASAAPHACPKQPSVPVLSSSPPSSTAAPIIASSSAASPTVRVDAAAPAEYTANPSIGGGGSNLVESAHFRVLGASTSSKANKTLLPANYYESWSFIAYLTNNPDSYAGLGHDTLLRMIREYKLESNETPLHTLERLLSEATGNVTVQQVVAAHEAFTAQRRGLTYDNLDGSNGEYTVRSARAPRYLDANIIPLTATGSSVDVAITSEDAGYTATLVVSNTSGVNYTDVVAGKGSVQVAEGDEASLVVAKTPELVMYDAFKISDELNQGLQYSVKITGATA